jgi:Glutamine amidotransferases class-II
MLIICMQGAYATRGLPLHSTRGWRASRQAYSKTMQQWYYKRSRRRLMAHKQAVWGSRWTLTLNRQATALCLLLFILGGLADAWLFSRQASNHVQTQRSRGYAHSFWKQVSSGSKDTSLFCQLLGMNCESPTEFALSWPSFCERGGLSDIHADGWGLVSYTKLVSTLHTMSVYCKSHLVFQTILSTLSTPGLLSRQRSKAVP